jgi:low affinity Fe/Cu permease
MNSGTDPASRLDPGRLVPDDLDPSTIVSQAFTHRPLREAVCAPKRPMRWRRGPCNDPDGSLCAAMERWSRGTGGTARAFDSDAAVTRARGHTGSDARHPGSTGLRDRFNRAADRVTNALGSLPALLASVLLVVLWVLTGPIFHFSDTWQLFINTTTTVVTFWMVFVIQNSSNRASKATQLKLDELIRAVHDARNEFIELDREPENVLVEREKELMEIAEAGDANAGRPVRADGP